MAGRIVIGQIRFRLDNETTNPLFVGVTKQLLTQQVPSYLSGRPGKEFAR
jgi:hypothetical protein